MKRCYSVILLISLFVGTLQPILPMVEYQLYKGSIMELLGSGEEDIKTTCQVTLCIMDNCENQEAKTERNLLDVNYYPLALEITTVSDPHVFLSSTRFYLPSVKSIISPTFLPNPPPPRLS